ncbi:hypothetical protein ACTMTF_41230 [Nonomuraea sp. ZG12]|uniref:hypothetical protein n=1 Tax=Nonomuraea sp. ZG12 TaxID=3452207 RepID=UPI003F88BDB2
MTSAAAAASCAEGDLRFIIVLADGRAMHARRALVATGLRDVLPDIPGLARHWGHGVVHCPYCATDRRCVTNPSASWPWARPRSTTHSCSVS